jgi:hypothetical protein
MIARQTYFHVGFIVYCALSFVTSPLAEPLSGNPIRRFHGYATDGLSVTGDGGGGSGSCMNPTSLLGEGGGSPSSEKCNPSEK